jgi:hypothetical protein
MIVRTFGPRMSCHPRQRAAPAIAPSAAVARLVALLVALSPGLARATPLDDIQALVEANRAADAYPLCAQIDRVAEPKADLWCGIAAVDVGRSGEGVFALERHTLRVPDDLRGRLELARAYFYARDNARSRQEFTTVLATDPPDSVRIGIQRYLDALTSREAQYTPTLTAWIEAGVGYDSNVNAGVQQADITLPVLGQVVVNEFGVKQSDGFGWLAGSIQYNRPVAPGWTLYAGIAGNGNYYFQDTQFNLGQAALNLGGSYQSGPDTLALTYAHGELYLDGSRYRWTDGVALEWRRQLDSTTMVSVTPQAARIAYADRNEVSNADFWAVGVGLRKIWLITWQPVLNVSAFGGKERNTEGRPDLGRDVFGAGANVTVSPSPMWALNAGFAYLKSDYDGPIPLIDVTRKDDNYVVNLGALYLFARQWGARLEYQYAKNASNVELYDYQRNVVALKLRYEFK